MERQSLNLKRLSQGGTTAEYGFALLLGYYAHTIVLFRWFEELSLGRRVGANVGPGRGRRDHKRVERLLLVLNGSRNEHERRYSMNAGQSRERFQVLAGQGGDPEQGHG